jgi:hypothetical protein
MAHTYHLQLKTEFLSKKAQRISDFIGGIGLGIDRINGEVYELSYSTTTKPTTEYIARITKGLIDLFKKDGYTAKINLEQIKKARKNEEHKTAP